MKTANIEKFLATAYSDEKLAALLAHCQDGKLSYWSCCCLIGSTNATHQLRGIELSTINADAMRINPELSHVIRAREVPFAKEAEVEFHELAFDPGDKVVVHPQFRMDIAAKDDAKRRERLIPLIQAEMDRRERKKIAALPEYRADYRDELGTDAPAELEIGRYQK